jgi:cold shock CspA family protein
VRLQGKIQTWNDDRGFGFVVQNSTNEKAFVHISAVADRHRRPVVGALVTYELVQDKRGPKAVDVRYVGQKRTSERKEGSAVRSVAVSVAFALGLAAFAYQRFARAPVAPGATEFATESRSASEDLPESPAFQCEPKKTYCREMSSCDEAYFHQNQCGGTKMDGDGDGIPCEDQWCGH